MGRRRFLLLAIFVCLLASACGRELNVRHKHVDHAPVYNHTLATIMAEYASAVYMTNLTALFTWTCSRCTGLIEDFEIIEVVIDVDQCLQAFVGVAQDLNAVVIAFRGTHGNSIQNWVADLSWRQLDLHYPNMDDATVHHGFYSAYHNTTIRSGILDAVKKAKEYYGEDLGIMLTGHSMGAAMAAFCGLDLVVNYKEKNVQVMTFGQPRIGNAAFASYYSQLVPNTIRVVNDHDMVPHLPPYYPLFSHKSYHHFPTEVWLHKIGWGSLSYVEEKVCDDSGEDPTCSRSVMGTSIVDHLVYYGIDLMGHSWKCFGGALDPRLNEYGTTDSQGNIFLSRNPASPVLKLKSEIKAPQFLPRNG